MRKARNLRAELANYLNFMVAGKYAVQSADAASGGQYKNAREADEDPVTRAQLALITNQPGFPGDRAVRAVGENRIARMPDLRRNGAPFRNMAELREGLLFADKTLEQAATLAAKAGLPVLADAESDKLGKFTLQAGAFPGGAYPVQGLGGNIVRYDERATPSAIRLMKDAARIMIRRWKNPSSYRDSAHGEQLAARLYRRPVDRNPGWPGWEARLEHHMPHLIAGADYLRTGDHVNFELRLKRWARSVFPRGTGAVLQPIGTSFDRTGQAKGPVDLYLPAPDGPLFMGNAKGLFCRRRFVNGVPAGYNVAQLTLAAAMTKAMKSSSQMGLGMAGPTALGKDPETGFAIKFRRLMARGFTPLSNDVSAFDNAVNPDIGAIVRAALAELPGVTEAALWPQLRVAHLPVLVPPVVQGMAGGVAPRATGEPSGELVTNLYDTAVNMVREIAALKAAARGEPEALAAFYQALESEDGVPIFMSADDVTSFVPAGITIDPDVYKQVSADMGFKATTFSAATILRWYMGSAREGYFGPTRYMWSFIQSVLFPERKDPHQKLSGYQKARLLDWMARACGVVIPMDGSDELHPGGVFVWEAMAKRGWAPPLSEVMDTLNLIKDGRALDLWSGDKVTLKALREDVHKWVAMGILSTEQADAMMYSHVFDLQPLIQQLVSDDVAETMFNRAVRQSTRQLLQRSMTNG